MVKLFPIHNAGYRGTRCRWVVIFTPQEKHTVPTEQEAGWAPQPVWPFWKSEKSLARSRIWILDHALLCSIQICCTAYYFKTLLTTAGAHRTSDNYKSCCKEKLESTSDSCYFMVMWQCKSNFQDHTALKCLSFYWYPLDSLVKIYHMQKTNYIYRVQSTQLIHILRIMYQPQRLYVIMKDKRIITVMYDDVET